MVKLLVRVAVGVKVEANVVSSGDIYFEGLVKLRRWIRRLPLLPSWGGHTALITAPGHPGPVQKMQPELLVLTAVLLY